MKVITFLNEKGGVGKTTLAGTTAAGLAILGQSVLLLDGDPQGHATLMYGLAKEPGLYNLLVNDAEFSEVMKPIEPDRYGTTAQDVKGRLFVLPSNVDTRNIVREDSNTLVLKDRLEELDGKIDVVVIDTPPTPSLLHGMIYMATDGIIYPTKLEFWSFDGLVESMGHRKQVDAIRPGFGLKPMEVMGIVPNMYRTDTLEQIDNMQKLKEGFGNQVWEPIRLRTVWTEVATFRKSVFAIAPKTQAARDAWTMVKAAERGLYVTA